MFTHDTPSQGEFLSVYFGRVPSGHIELFYLWPEGMETKVSKPRFPTYAPLPLNRAIPDREGRHTLSIIRLARRRK